MPRKFLHNLRLLHYFQYTSLAFHPDKGLQDRKIITDENRRTFIYAYYRSFQSVEICACFTQGHCPPVLVGKSVRIPDTDMNMLFQKATSPKSQKIPKVDLMKNWLIIQQELMLSSQAMRRLLFLQSASQYNKNAGQSKTKK